MRKFVGVPTQLEITEQFNTVKNWVCNVSSFEQAKEIENNFREIEINGENISLYNNEPIEFIRYEYENILVYVNIINDNIIISEYITLYDDEGEQFGDELYYQYEGVEIERVNKMGLLKIAE